jgi:hypothetical protein
VAELERKIGQQALEIDFLNRCLQHRRTADAAIYRQVSQEMNGQEQPTSGMIQLLFDLFGVLTVSNHARA